MNSSYQETEQTNALTETLNRVNPMLHPDALSALVPEYKKFQPFRKAYGLWSSLDTIIETYNGMGQYDKVMLLVSGVAGSGKNTIHDAINEVNPDLMVQPVTSTTRSPRAGEVDGVDYDFYPTRVAFEKDVAEGKFLEWVDQKGRLYGLPKSSLQQAIKDPSPVIWTQIEMLGWDAVENYVLSQPLLNMFVLKMFILPYHDYKTYKKRIFRERVDDPEARLERSSWEIAEAPKRAGYIVSNRFSDDPRPLARTAKAIVAHTQQLLSSNEHYVPLPRDFEISPGVSEIAEILRAHDAVR